MRWTTIITLALLAGCSDDSGGGKYREPGAIEGSRVLRARMEIRQLVNDVSMYEANRGEWPENWRAVRRSGIDPWGNEYALEILDGRPEIWSAGPDGELGTADDVTHEP